jgi:DNA-binding beta-propeller fold protein YncE
MKRKIFSYGSVGWGIILLITISILVFYSNCTKKSTRYEPRKGYYLYASDIGSSERKQIYVFSTETDSLVDSIYLGPDLYATALGLSPDKRTLYARCERILSDTSREYLGCEIDTRTKTLKYIGPNSFPIISPEGRYLFGDTKGKFTIFDAYSHQIVYQDTVSFLPLCFDKKANLAYGTWQKVEDYRLGIFDYKSMRWVRASPFYLRDGSIALIGAAVLSLDGNRLYLVAVSPAIYIYFCVYDLSQDSLLVQIEINWGTHQLGIRPDGSTVYRTDHGGGSGCFGWEPSPSGELSVFDTKTNTSLPNISLDPLADSLYPPPLGTDFIRITPDGKKAYLSQCGEPILVIDLIRNEPLKVIYLPNRIWYWIAL